MKTRKLVWGGLMLIMFRSGKQLSNGETEVGLSFLSNMEGC